MAEENKSEFGERSEFRERREFKERKGDENVVFIGNKPFKVQQLRLCTEV